MIHARKDYNRIQDPANPETNPGVTAKDWREWGMHPASSPIGTDEPVFLLRAQDRNFIPMLRAYERLLRQDPKVETAMLTAVEMQIRLAMEWQAEHGSKTPDL